MRYTFTPSFDVGSTSPHSPPRPRPCRRIGRSSPSPTAPRRRRAARARPPRTTSTCAADVRREPRRRTRREQRHGVLPARPPHQMAAPTVTIPRTTASTMRRMSSAPAVFVAHQASAPTRTRGDHHHDDLGDRAAIGGALDVGCPLPASVRHRRWDRAGEERVESVPGDVGVELKADALVGGCDRPVAHVGIDVEVDGVQTVTRNSHDDRVPTEADPRGDLERHAERCLHRREHGLGDEPPDEDQPTDRGDGDEDRDHDDRERCRRGRTGRRRRASRARATSSTAGTQPAARPHSTPPR